MGCLKHQSLKELAQRSDEEVVKLWLEQRGLFITRAEHYSAESGVEDLILARLDAIEKLLFSISS